MYGVETLCRDRPSQESKKKPDAGTCTVLLVRKALSAQPRKDITHWCRWQVGGNLHEARVPCRGVVLSNMMFIWVAVKELNLRYYIGGTILISVYIYNIYPL